MLRGKVCCDWLQAGLPEGKKRLSSAASPAGDSAAQHSVVHGAAQPVEGLGAPASPLSPGIAQSLQPTGSSGKPAAAQPAASPPLLSSNTPHLAALNGEAGERCDSPARSNGNTAQAFGPSHNSNAVTDTSAGGSQAAADGVSDISSKQAAVLATLGLAGQPCDPRIQGTLR